MDAANEQAGCSPESPTSSHVLPPDKQARLEVLREARQSWLAEMLDYNKRLDNVSVLYLSAAYAAIGLQTAGKLDLSAAADDDRYVWVAFAFIFLNVCIMLHLFSQGAWCMALAKFVHLKVDSEILRLLGAPVVEHHTKTKSAPLQLDEVGFLGWDDWEAELKGLALGTRNDVTVLWMLLVVISSAASLVFVNVPHFLATYGYAAWVPIIVLVLLHLLAALRGTGLRFFVGAYHYPRVDLSPGEKRKLWCVALGITASVVAVGCVAAMWRELLGLM